MAHQHGFESGKALMTTHPPPSERTTLKRGKENGTYDPADIRLVLKAGLVAHVGVTTDQGPIVLPMAYGVRGDEILIHGGVANAMMRAARDVDVCVTVTIIDGFVVARTPLETQVIVDVPGKLDAFRVTNTPSQTS